ncbi:hypothetical protein ACFV4G_28000 [Kitasatospora sp. NPDC059747]|uniref:hypothetical protein n=1 Tax=Kitasatospora sp. NPDC059747 TaxID=3346930 RepID=UPI003656B681
MKKALYLTPLLILAAYCASSAPVATLDGSVPTAPPDERRQRTLACGTTIAPPRAESLAGDHVYLTLPRAELDDTGIAVTYRITAKDPAEMLTLPFIGVPPTALLVKDGKIVATQTPHRGDGPTATVALGYRVGEEPYEEHLTIDRACPGTSFKDVATDPGRYRVVTVMSVQGAGMPEDMKTVPLVQASAALGVTA